MFEYINEYYKVPAEFSREIIYQNKRKGVIVEDLGNYIGVNFEDKKPGVVEPLHPTWEVEYLNSFGEIRKQTKGQKRYQEYLKADTRLSFIDWLKINHK